MFISRAFFPQLFSLPHQIVGGHAVKIRQCRNRKRADVLIIIAFIFPPVSYTHLEGTSKLYVPSVPKKPSVRKELNEIKAARKKEAEGKVQEAISKEKSGRTRQTQHTQPQNRKKPRKSKAR